MSSHLNSIASPSKEIFVLSEASSIKLGDNCYKKVPGFFGAETHNVSSISSESENCHICKGDLKTVDASNHITINKNEQCLIINLSNNETSNINIYNNKTTLSHTIKSSSNNLLLDYGTSSEKTLSNSNKVVYLESSFLTIKVEYIKDDTNTYLCFTQDPFRERCNTKFGVKHSELSSKTFQRLDVYFYKDTSEQKVYQFTYSSSLTDTIKSIETFFNNLFLNSVTNIQLKINPLNNNLMFWKPYGNAIKSSDISIFTYDGTTQYTCEITNLSDHDFDGIADSDDPYPYGGTYSNKIVFKSNDPNLTNFMFGDSISLQISPAFKENYVVENFSSIEESLSSLSLLINSDFNNNLNTLYSRFFGGGNLSYIEIWDPCLLSYPSSSKISLIKKSIDLKTKKYYTDNSYSTNYDGPYLADSGAFKFNLFLNTDTSTNLNSSGNYFISSDTHNSKPIYKNNSNSSYTIIWSGTDWRLALSGDINAADKISFGDQEYPSKVLLSSSLDSTHGYSFNLGLNGSPTFKNSTNHYIFKQSLGNWFVTDQRYGITSSDSSNPSKHISESTIC